VTAVFSISSIQISWRDLLDIALVAFVFYRAIMLVKGTRAVAVIHGMILLGVIYYLSGELGLSTLHWLLTNFISSFFLVIIVLFQTDIRKALARMGTGTLWRGSRRVRVEETVEELTSSAMRLARTRTGALIVLQKHIPLGDVIARGMELSAKVSRELLLTIFNTATPLHDGAVLVRGDKVVAVACILPLTTGVRDDPSMGTRHRAAIGITEESDAVAVVVSEERGQVSVASGGKLEGPLDEDGLRAALTELWGRRL
jgi:diadenylate cyclase